MDEKKNRLRKVWYTKGSPIWKELMCNFIFKLGMKLSTKQLYWTTVLEFNILHVRIQQASMTGKHLVFPWHDSSQYSKMFFFLRSKPLAFSTLVFHYSLSWRFQRNTQHGSLAWLNCVHINKACKVLTVLEFRYTLEARRTDAGLWELGLHLSKKKKIPGQTKLTDKPMAVPLKSFQRGKKHENWETFITYEIVLIFLSHHSTFYKMTSSLNVLAFFTEWL